MVTGNGQLLTIRAERQLVYMFQGDRCIAAGGKNGDAD